MAIQLTELEKRQFYSVRALIVALHTTYEENCDLLHDFECDDKELTEKDLKDVKQHIRSILDGIVELNRESKILTDHFIK